jgi:hypothetical protein
MQEMQGLAQTQCQPCSRMAPAMQRIDASHAARRTDSSNRSGLRPTWEGNPRIRVKLAGLKLAQEITQGLRVVVNERWINDPTSMGVS